MPDFLFDNPFISILILYGIYRMIFGGGKKKAAEAQLRAEALKQEASRGNKGVPARTERTANSTQATLKERIEAAMRDMEGSLAALQTPTPAATTPAPARDLEEGAIGEGNKVFDSEIRPEAVVTAEQQFASRPLIDPKPVRTDYDLRLDAFAFHAADEAPEKNYRVGSFDQMTTSSSLRPSPIAGADAGSISDPASTGSIDRFLATDDDLYRAIIMREILGPPKGQRALRSTSR